MTPLPMLQHDTSSEVTEGLAKLQLPPEPRNVFYNPKMSMNRDLAMLFVNSYFPSSERVQLCDPMTGSGVRAVRYLLETPNVNHVVAADRDLSAVQLAQETVLRNGLKDRVAVVQSDAYTLLSNHSTDRFDMIDLDPFGSPAPFFESALRATTDEGVIAATATDMGPLSGARPRACMRKYGISPVRAEFGKELAIRTLASCLSTAACRMELGLQIQFSHSTDHYARLYAVARKGRKVANQTLQNLGYLIYCPTCLLRSEAQSISFVQGGCVNCGAPARVGGPLWFGPLWDRETVESMVRHTPHLDSSQLSRIQRLLGLVQGEVGAPSFYYTTAAMASAYGVNPPSLNLLIESLRECGNQAAGTHFSSTGFRTDASLQTIVACFRRIAQKS